MSATHAEAAIARRSPAMAEFIVIIAMMMALTALSIDIMLPAFPAMRDYFGLADANAVQLVVTWYVLGFAGGQIVYGPISDRFGRKPVLLAGLVVYALGSVGTYLAPDFETLLIARAVQGVGCAAPRVIAIAMVRDMFGGRRMARVMSFVMLIFIMVPVLAPSIGEGLMLVGEWQWIFLFLLGASLVLMPVTQLRLPETRAPKDREPLSFRWLVEAFTETLTTRQTLGYTLATGFVFGCLMGYINSAQQILGSLYDLGSYFSLVFGAITIALALAALTNSWLVEKIGMRRLSHGALAGFLAVALVHVAIALSLPGPPPLAVFCGLLAIDLFCFGFIMPNFNAMAMEPLQRIAGTASSFVGCFTTGAAAIFGWVIGQLYDGTVLPLTSGYAILSAIALGIVLITEKGRLFHPLHGEDDAR